MKMKQMIKLRTAGKTGSILVFIFSFLMTMAACTDSNKYTYTFSNTNDRIWIGKDFWAIPLEDWKIKDGMLHCTGTEPHSRVNLLTQSISPETGSFKISLSAGLIEKSEVPGAAGLLIGVPDEEDPDVRA